MPHRYSRSTTQLGNGPASELKPALTEKNNAGALWEEQTGQKVSCRKVLRGSLLGSTSGMGRGKPVGGRGAATQGKYKKVLVATKGALELAPK